MRTAAKRSLVVTGEMLIPLSLVAGLVAAMVGGVNYVSGLKYKVEEHTGTEAEFAKKLDEHAKALSEIRQDTAATNAKVSILLEMAKEQRRSGK